MPGSRVDVLVTRKIDQDTTETKVIQRDLLVVAVDQQLGTDKERRPTVQTVTMAVPEKDTPALVKAMKQGEVSLVLRKPDEPKDGAAK